MFIRLFFLFLYGFVDFDCALYEIMKMELLFVSGIGDLSTDSFVKLRMRHNGFTGFL